MNTDGLRSLHLNSSDTKDSRKSKRMSIAGGEIINNVKNEFSTRVARRHLLMKDRRNYQSPDKIVTRADITEGLYGSTPSRRLKGTGKILLSDSSPTDNTLMVPSDALMRASSNHSVLTQKTNTTNTTDHNFTLVIDTSINIGPSSTAY